MFARASFPGSCGGSSNSYGYGYPSSTSTYGPPRSCAHQAHRSFGRPAGPPASAFFMDTDEPSEESYGYYDYLRREAERRQLVEAQARRRANEEAFLAQLRESEHEAARARARARAEAEYKAKVDEQRRRAAHEHARAQEEREAQRELRRRAQAAYQAHLARSIFGVPHPAAFRQSSDGGSEHLHQQQQQQHRTPTVAVVVPTAPTSYSRRPAMSPEQAAHVIQVQLRRYIVVRRRLHSVAAIRAKFESLRSSFVQPKSFIFDSAKSSDADPVLAFSAPNSAYHAYVESLTRLLTDLDEIASEGSQAVKAERRQLVVAIEEELSRLEKAKLQAWEAQKNPVPAAAQAEEPHGAAQPQEAVSHNVDAPASNASSSTNVQPAEEESSPESVKATTVTDDEDESLEVAAALVHTTPADSAGHDSPMISVLEEKTTETVPMQVDSTVDHGAQEVNHNSKDEHVDADTADQPHTLDNDEASADVHPNDPANASPVTAEHDEIMLVEHPAQEDPFDDQHRVQHPTEHHDSGSDNEFVML